MSARTAKRLASLEALRLDLIRMGAGMAVLQVNGEIAALRRRIGGGSK